MTRSSARAYVSVALVPKLLLGNEIVGEALLRERG